jgi:predicted methyltransferase
MQRSQSFVAAAALALSVACGAPQAAPARVHETPATSSATATSGGSVSSTTASASASATPSASASSASAPAAAANDTPALARARGIVDAKDRIDDDRRLDAGRHPAELLAFLGVEPGQRIGDVGAWHGYTADLLGRAVAPSGAVYAQDPAAFDKFTKDAWAARKSSSAMKNITRIAREYADPFPPDVRDLDAVVCGLFYHDMVWLKVDRAKMNAAIFRALKKHGVYLVFDHSGRDGTGATETKTIHRIEEKVVRAEIAAAGFELVETASFLRNPEDTRDWDASDSGAKERRGKSDRFVLKFVKP